MQYEAPVILLPPYCCHCIKGYGNGCSMKRWSVSAGVTYTAVTTRGAIGHGSEVKGQSAGSAGQSACCLLLGSLSQRACAELDGAA